MALVGKNGTSRDGEEDLASFVGFSLLVLWRVGGRVRKEPCPRAVTAPHERYLAESETPTAQRGAAGA